MQYLKKPYRNTFFIILLLLGMFWIGYHYSKSLNKQEPEPTPSIAKKPVVTAVKSYSQNDLLLDIKLARDRERSREEERIQDILDKIGLSDDIRKQAERELWRLTQAVSKEQELENLLKANGFNHCLVNINNELITVVIDRLLKPEQVKFIGQSAAEVTGFSLEKIQIVEKPDN